MNIMVIVFTLQFGDMFVHSQIQSEYLGEYQCIAHELYYHEKPVNADIICHNQILEVDVLGNTKSVVLGFETTR